MQWIKRVYWEWVFIFILFFIVAGWGIQSASAQTPVPEYCELTSTIEKIKTYYCEPPLFPAYFTNSVGWIAIDK